MIPAVRAATLALFVGSLLATAGVVTASAQVEGTPTFDDCAQLAETGLDYSVRIGNDHGHGGEHPVSGWTRQGKVTVTYDRPLLLAGCSGTLTGNRYGYARMRVKIFGNGWDDQYQLNESGFPWQDGSTGEIHYGASYGVGFSQFCEGHGDGEDLLDFSVIFKGTYEDESVGRSQDFKKTLKKRKYQNVNCREL